MNQVTQYRDDDDGFGGSLASGQLIKGQILRWTETRRIFVSSEDYSKAHYARCRRVKRLTRPRRRNALSRIAR
jgi:hypothetical protein